MARLRLTAALALLVSSALGVPPVVTLFNDTGNGTALVNWSPTAGANDYLVSAESFSFQETFPDGAMTPGGGKKLVGNAFLMLCELRRLALITCSLALCQSVMCERRNYI